MENNVETEMFTARDIHYIGNMRWSLDQETITKYRQTHLAAKLEHIPLFKIILEL